MRNSNLFQVVALLLAAVAVHAQSNLVLINSAPGDPIGGGLTYATENAADFSVSGTPGLITVNAFGFTIWIAGPNGANLAVGTYGNSARYPFNGSQPGLDIFGNGIGCNTDCGSFQINELQLGPSGQVFQLWMTYSNECDCNGAPTTGEIRYNSQLAPAIIIITQQPANQLIYSGDTAVISVGALGQTPLYYNWFCNGSNVAVTTNAQLAISDFQTANAGIYTVTVTNALASVVSSSATLAVTNAAPVILIQPTDIYGALGSNAVFVVQAVGSQPFNYQWQLNGNSLDEATNGTLALANLQFGNQGNYAVVISNLFGCATSSPAHLTVRDMNDFNAALNTTNLLWTVGGDVPWFVQANPTLMVDPWGLYPYSVTYDGVSSMQSGNTLPGQQSFLQASIMGPATLTFWWQAVSESSPDYLSVAVNGVEQARISGITAWQQQTLFLGAGTNVLQWAYNETDSQTSSQAAGWVDQVAVTPGGTPPFITLAPAGQVVLLGSNATLNAAALGTPPLAYQWQLNLTNIAGATGTNLILSNVRFTDEGNYVLVVSNSFGVTHTAAVFVDVVDFTVALNATNLVWSSGGDLPWFPETATTHDGVAALQSGAIAGSQQSTVATTADGPGTLNFWWKVSSETNNDFVNFSVDNGEQSRISGAVNWQQKTFYLTPGAHPLAWSYSKNATINGGSDSAWLDQVSYVPGPTTAFAAAGPTDQAAAISSNATFTVSAQGTPPITYQWLFNGVAIPGATNAALTITNVQVTNSGDYAVTLCNDYGCSTSTNAFLYLFDVYAWGAGQSNTVVSPNYGQSKVPFNLFAVTAVAGGGYHSLALRNNGRVTAWGDNNYGETNVPATLTNAVAIAAGLYHSVALRSNGTVTAWGFSGYGQTTVPAAATNVGAIAAGWDHTLALRTNGTVLAWGAGTSRNLWPNLGQCLVPTNLTGVSAIAAGGYHSLALRTNGTVVAWGWNAFGQTNVPAGLTNVVAIAAGGSNSIALKNDGTLVVWGANESGQTNIPTGLSNVVAIAAGAAHDLALKNDGTLVAWGLNANAQTNLPAGVANVTAISAGAYHTLALINVGPISFLSPPVGQTIFQGSNATFTVACLGSAPLAYQWRLNGTNLSGATNSSFTVSNAPLSAAGNYQVVVSNAFGVVASAIAVLMVSDVAPFFTAPPASTFVFQNSNVTLTASAGGLPPFNYQWLFNGAAIGGETSLSLTISNAQPANQGSYVVVASNAFGIANSAATFLDVVDVPQALGATNLTWFNPGLPVWFAEATNTHDGFAAAASGKLAYGQQNQLQTFVTGPGELTFWWSGQQNVTMGFQIDGVQQISQGFYYASTWNQLTYYLPSKVHLLTWTAANQFSLFYTNLGFLDQVVFTPGTTPVSITGQPGNQTVAAGNNVTFSVVAIGTPPFGYQWYFNGSPLPDATSSSLTLNNVQASAGGTYNVSVITGNNTLVSSNAVLTISPSAPVITSQPVGGPTMTGGTFAFSSGAIGSSPIAYQWLWNGLPITGGTNATFNLNNIQYAAAGNYSLLASNTVGTAVSSNALLFVYSIGDLGTALDNPGLNWSTTNMPWFPQTNTTYDGVSAAQSGAISGSQQSTLQATVTGPAMVIYWWMVDCDGFWDSLTFSANDTVLSSITGSVGWQQTTNYIGSGTQVLQWKLYPVYGAFAGGTGWLDQVQVIPISGTDVVITAQSGNLTTSAGDNVTFSVTATGTPPLGYQWEFNGTNLPGANSSTLTLNNVQGANAGSYGVVVTNDFGFASSSNATLVVNPSGPVIISQPASQTNLVNSSAEFSVSVQGTPSFSYQWYFNGSAIAGANSSFLVVSNLKPANAGHYDVIVSNVLGSATSANASLSVVSSKVYEFWPYNHAGYTAPANSGSLTAIAVGASHTMALRTDGTVSVWGNNYYGQTNLPAGLSNVVAIAAGDTHCLALKADGTVVAWGGFGYGQGTVPAGLSNVVAIAAGPTYNVALKADGTVAGWGSDKYGETDIPAGLTNVQAIFAGYFNGFALTADGSLTQWGNDPVWQHDGTNTQLRLSGRATNVAGVAAGSFSGWSLQNDGSVLAYGWYDGVAPFTNSYGTGTTWNPGVQSRNTYNNIAAMAAYGNSSPFAEYALLLGTNGTITPVGGSGGQIGIAGSYVPYITTSPSSPFPTSPANVAAIAAGNAHAAALVTDGSPHISRPAISRVVFTGDTVVFSTSASGQAPLSYQWLFNNTKIDSATNAVLVLTNVPLSAAGNYCCAVSNSVGTVTGLQATLTVLRSTLRFDSVLPFSANGFSWQLDQLSGHGAIIIYVSTNLTDWVPILTNAPVTGSIEFLDSGATNEPARFYRAVEQ